jgi:hypothetical protein
MEEEVSRRARGETFLLDLRGKFIPRIGKGGFIGYGD